MVKAAINLNKDLVLDVLKEMHETLKRYGIKDNHIALFGSFYDGVPNEDSDIDMIIISDMFEGKDIFERIDMTAKAELDIHKKYVVPMDILLKTTQEYNNHQKKYFNSQLFV